MKVMLCLLFVLTLSHAATILDTLGSSEKKRNDDSGENVHENGEVKRLVFDTLGISTRNDDVGENVHENEEVKRLDLDTFGSSNKKRTDDVGDNEHENGIAKRLNGLNMNQVLNLLLVLTLSYTATVADPINSSKRNDNTEIQEEQSLENTSEELRNFINGLSVKTEINPGQLLIRKVTVLPAAVYGRVNG